MAHLNWRFLRRSRGHDHKQVLASSIYTPRLASRFGHGRRVLHGWNGLGHGCDHGLPLALLNWEVDIKLLNDPHKAALPDSKIRRGSASGLSSVTQGNDLVGKVAIILAGELEPATRRYGPQRGLGFAQELGHLATAHGLGEFFDLSCTLFGADLALAAGLLLGWSGPIRLRLRVMALAEGDVLEAFKLNDPAARREEGSLRCLQVD
ncbi:hypothetical protein [Pseudomonas mosselii]|uniref:hypothetical protein n=1 Tax=Pseudomonas mosselii TaxID=78327 RepID=UPI003F405F6D